MRTVAAFVLLLLACSALGQPVEPPPTGRLSDAVRPTAYRLELTIDPRQPSFVGHAEIDVVLAAPTRGLFLHGNELRVDRATISVGSTTRPARYAQVDPSGVARLDVDSELPAGNATLRFDYTADFLTGSEGLYRAQVAGEWYAWTQMEPIAARLVFPSFDDPQFKTPFTVTITAPSDVKVFANAPEVEAVAASEDVVVHRFAATKRLPTYLIAFGVGPFDVAETTVPPNAVRTQPLPFRVIATKGQAPRMQTALVETPKLLESLENYVGLPYPFEKLDFIASPTHAGAMENPGLVVFSDTFILLDASPSFVQLRLFAEAVGHELAHQWFGNSVTPLWWTDLWLNESFAQWLGKKVGDQWRPDLGLAMTEVVEAFAAMNADSLDPGRPIRQEIAENRQIGSAFDSITYQKGAQVLSMFESYLGAERFREGVRLHLSRYRYGSATADDFFRSLAEAADDPNVVPAMRTFTDQTGVPVVSVHDGRERIALAHSRYVPLGLELDAEQVWTIPFCAARGARRSCALLDSTETTIAAIDGRGALLPNAGAAGYYRFRLDDAGWDRLIASADTLPGRDALAFADSLWADFAAGTASFARVVAGARSLSGHAEHLAAVELGVRLASLGAALLTDEQLPRLRALLASIYAPRLADVGLDVGLGAHAAEPTARQALRQTLVPIVAFDGRDDAVRTQLTAAAEAWLDGDAAALDPAFRSSAFGAAVQEHGERFMRSLRDALADSTDPALRLDAADALGRADTPALARLALELAFSPGVQPLEAVTVIANLARQPGARDSVARFADESFEQLSAALPTFFLGGYLAGLFDGYCSEQAFARVDALLPRLQALGGGDLELAQAKERIALCIALKEAKGAEIAAVLDGRLRATR